MNETEFEMNEEDFFEGMDAMADQLAQDEEWARHIFERTQDWWNGS